MPTDTIESNTGTTENKRRPLTLIGKTLIIAFATLVLLICADVYLAAVFHVDKSMIVIPAFEITWTTLGFVMLLYGCLAKKPGPLAFPLLAWIPSMLMRFVGLLMLTMMAFFPDSYTSKLNKLGDNVKEDAVQKVAMTVIVLSLVLGGMEITTTIYTLFCRYHLKEVSARRRRRDLTMKRRNRNSADKVPSQAFESYALNSSTGTGTEGDERTRSSTPQTTK